jgi:hypothetical protein
MIPPAPPSPHIASSSSDVGGASERKGGTLLDWWLQKYLSVPTPNCGLSALGILVDWQAPSLRMG